MAARVTLGRAAAEEAMRMRSWRGAARYLFIPLVVTGAPGFNPPPPDYREFVRRRLYYDPDPATGVDRSLARYMEAVSYGRAWLDATVCEPVTIDRPATGANLTLAAIYAQPDSHLYPYLAVVYPPNNRGAGSGMAQPGRIDFSPPREPNRTRARARFRHDDPIGTYAMEVLHNVTDIGDYYNGLAHPGRFDEMADAAATHPTTYTKMLAGWLDEDDVPVHAGGTAAYTLHALGLAHPAPAGRVSGVQVRVHGTGRSVYIEARMRSDPWESGVQSDGIPSEGVVVCEYAPESDPWPRQDPNGPWPPLELRTPRALRVGESYEHVASRTTVTVSSPTVGGFRIRVETEDVVVPHVQERRLAAAVAAVQGAGLVAQTVGQTGPGAWVWRQSPPGGSRVPAGSQVTLQARTGPIP